MTLPASDANSNMKYEWVQMRGKFGTILNNYKLLMRVNMDLRCAAMIEQHVMYETKRSSF